MTRVPARTVFTVSPTVARIETSLAAFHGGWWFYFFAGRPPGAATVRV
jgi:hypothetical protein